jgi:hypothetical protein
MRDDKSAAVFVTGLFAGAVFFYSFIISKQPKKHRVLAKVLQFPKRAS